MAAVENSSALRPISSPSYFCPCCGQRLQPTGLTLDRASRSAFRNGRVVRLKQREFEVLSALMAAFPKPVDTAQLYSLTHSVRPAVACLRDNIAFLGLEVRNIRCLGYVLASATP